MAKILCKYSGLYFSCEHLPTSISSNEYYHPLFSLPKKKLLLLTRDWAAQKLSVPETFLLYLSLLNSTDLIIWRSAAKFTDNSVQIIANNMESLLQIIGKIDLIQHPAFSLPKFSISPDTADLSNSYYWIQAWIHNYTEFMDGYRDMQKKEALKSRVERREHSLEHLIKSANSSPAAVANNLAHWAMLSGNFPEYSTIHPFTKTSVSLSEYWQQIIRACANEESIWRFPSADIAELIEHCEDNVVHGSIYAHSLMRLLREGLKKHNDYTGFGDVDLAGKTTSFKLLDANSTAEDANIFAAIQSAPEVEPKRHQYPTLGAYMRAKLNWDLKKRSGG